MNGLITAEGLRGSFCTYLKKGMFFFERDIFVVEVIEARVYDDNFSFHASLFESEKNAI